MGHLRVSRCLQPASLSAVDEYPRGDTKRRGLEAQMSCSWRETNGHLWRYPVAQCTLGQMH